MRAYLDDPSIATKDDKPGVKIQQGRAMGLVFPPSSYEPHPDEDAVPRASLQLQHFIQARLHCLIAALKVASHMRSSCVAASGLLPHWSCN